MCVIVGLFDVPSSMLYLMCAVIRFFILPGTATSMASVHGQQQYVIGHKGEEAWSAWW